MDVEADDAGWAMAPTRTIQLNRHHQIANALLRCRRGLRPWRHSIFFFVEFTQRTVQALNRLRPPGSNSSGVVARERADREQGTVSDPSSGG